MELSAAALQRLGWKVSGITIQAPSWEAISVSWGCACSLLLLIESVPSQVPADLMSGHQCGNISSWRKVFQQRYERLRKINAPNTKIFLEVILLEWRDTELLPILQLLETIFLFLKNLELKHRWLKKIQTKPLTSCQREPSGPFQAHARSPGLSLLGPLLGPSAHLWTVALWWHHQSQIRLPPPLGFSAQLWMCVSDVATDF